MKKVIYLFFIISFLSFSTCFAKGWQKPEFKYQQTYRYDIRHCDEDLYIHKFSIILPYKILEDKLTLKIIPYFNLRWYLDKDSWGKKGSGFASRFRYI